MYYKLLHINLLDEISLHEKGGKFSSGVCLVLGVRWGIFGAAK